MNEHLYTYENPCSERDLNRIVRLLQDDGVIAYPTDLNWGFGCLATSARGIDRLRRLKPGKTLPFSLIFDSISRASQYTTIEHVAYRVLKKSLPGPYTLILPRHRQLPRQLDDKRRTVGIRIPERPLLLELVSRLEVPLLTTSVPEEADGRRLLLGYEVFERYGHALDMVLDLGAELPGGETTIIDLTEGEVRVIREGAGVLDGLL
jgi:tRNA threonylcarbamoyl adenosine modification protein (Sua5/YciO/YrdC/YwlC family)